ncbi:MAG: hypothetical protein LBF97_03330 [Elusimicrobiota bacterium]|jgi:hypothetical protein|nr:hypothetical protein [Elusimicrobiota bacterium]
MSSILTRIRKNQNVVTFVINLESVNNEFISYYSSTINFKKGDYLKFNGNIYFITKAQKSKKIYNDEFLLTIYIQHINEHIYKKERWKRFLNKFKRWFESQNIGTQIFLMIISGFIGYLIGKLP